MIVVQLAFRGWLISRAWFQGDDLIWIPRSVTSDLTLDLVMKPYAGHLMPAGLALSWVNATISPLNWALPATEILVMQALASIGCLRLLLNMFGHRWGVLPPLAGFLFSTISLSTFVWWAPAVTLLPVLITIFFGLHSHISYLRTGQIRYALATCGWTLFGLAFCEKALLALEIYGIVALCYFSAGHLVERLGQLWRRYPAGMVLYLLMPVIYLPFYLTRYINFEATQVNDRPLGHLAFNMIGKAFATGVAGGPLEWFSGNVFAGVADPSDLVILLSWLIVGSVVFVAARTRTNSKRAWFVVGSVLFTDLLLLATGRAFVSGPVIGLEFRYQIEAAAAAALSLALAYLPLNGAIETVKFTARHAFVDSRIACSVAVATYAIAATYSSVQFAAFSLEDRSPETYYKNFRTSLDEQRLPVAMVDREVASRINPAFAFPTNLYSRMFVMYSDKIRYPTVSTDQLSMVDDRGRIRPVLIDALRHQLPGPTPDCGYEIQQGGTAIPLDAPVIGGPWLLRISYLASSDSVVRVKVGDQTFDTSIRAGVHSLYINVLGSFDSVVVSGLDDGVTMCTDEVTLGNPIPFEGP